MNTFLATFQAVAALLGIGVLGFWIIGRRKVPANALSLLNAIAIDLTLPCLVLGNLLVQFNTRDHPDWWRMPLWFVGFEALALLLALGAAFLVQKKIRSEFSLSLFLQNGIFFPLIIISGLFPGQASGFLVLLFLFTMFHPTVAFTVNPYFFRQAASNVKFNWVRIINPVLIATLVGIALGLAGAGPHVPRFLITILTMIGAMATPLFMLILGGNVYNDFKQNQTAGRRFYWAEIIRFVLVKNILFPAVFLALLIWFKPEYSMAFIIILQAAVPPITAIPIFTERAGGNRMLTNQFIIASFIASIITIPAVILVFSHFFPFPV
jgi:malate permease and related proteins